MKITGITVNNYRAFFNERGEEDTKYHIDLSGGKNLLVYGENGSGKSSLYKGLKDLFRSSMEDLKIIENVFLRKLTEVPDQDPFVEAVFQDNADESIYRFSGDPNLTNTNEEILKSVVRSRSFMTYRDLMRIHFIDGPQVNLFEFLFGENGLLAELPNPSPSQQETDIRINELWKVVLRDPDETNTGDLCNGINQILSDLTSPLNHLLKYFDESLSVKFTILTEDTVRQGAPFVNIDVRYFNIQLSEESEQYHHFLNEARLSALAICIFLAAHLSIPNRPYKVLFLDDIFTGLDTSNRIPLLDILTEEKIEGTESDTFRDHQIILTTYDRQWYELAKNHLGQTEWSYQELFINRHKLGFDHPVLLPGEDDLKKALHYFNLKQYPACANFQRKICETLIKQFLPDYKKFDAVFTGEIKPVDKLATLVDRLEGYLKENDLDVKPFSKLKNCLRIVMNPMSHDDLDSPVYRREIDLVFDIIKSLRTLRNTVILPQGRKIHFKKASGETGIMREYVCELMSPLRRLEANGKTVITTLQILPLTEQDAGSNKKTINYKDTLDKVYDKFCHSLKIEKSVNPFEDFSAGDGITLQELINLAAGE
jgi:energy-coupling factor transporter ATP-binding protein EcfA2